MLGFLRYVKNRKKTEFVVQLTVAKINQKTKFYMRFQSLVIVLLAMKILLALLEKVKKFKVWKTFLKFKFYTSKYLELFFHQWIILHFFDVVFPSYVMFVHIK